MKFRFIVLLLGLSLVSSTQADELILKDGKKIEWVTLHSENDTYEVTTPQGTKVVVKKADVERIVPANSSGPLTGATFSFDKKRKLETVDLLARVDIKKGVVSGSASMIGGKLTGADFTKLVIPFTPPSDEYDITIVAEREKPGEGFSFTFIGGGNQCMFAFDAEKGVMSGIQLVDGKNIFDNGLSLQGGILELKKPRTIVMMIRKEAFIIQLDGKDWFVWKPDWTKVSMPTVHAIPPRNQFGLGLSQNAIQISRILYTAPKEKP
jgi:hypothetical protein